MSGRVHTKIHLGEGLILDLETLIASKLLVQANSGGGKSWALRRLLEQTHGHIQQIVIDPEGEFSSLREKHDYILAAPTGGDVVADPRTAKLLALRLLELNVSAIIDIFELAPDQRVKFVKLFLDAMIDAPKSLWHPALVIVDEAQVYCPENSKAESASAVINACSRGRKRGFCVVLATQRISEVKKGAVADLNNKLIGRTSLDVDVKRAAEELGFTSKEDRRQLRQLRPGTFFAFGPAISDEVTKGVMGPVFTTHPEAGARIAFTPPPPTAKVKALLSKLADLPAEAAHEARTVDELRQENATLKRQVTTLERAKPAAEVKVKEVQVDRPVPFVPQEELKAVVGAAEAVVAAAKGLLAAAKKTPTVALSVQGIGGFKAGQRVVIGGPGGQVALVAAVEPRRRTISVRETGAPSSLSKAERLILNVLAQYPDGRTIVQVAVIARYSHQGGGFRNAIGALRSKGFIEGTGDNLRITDAGQDAVGEVDPLPMGRDLLRHWLGELGKAERSILEALDAAGGPLGIEELAAQAGYEAGGGGFRNALGKLRTLELISGRRGEDISLAEELR